VSNGRSLRPLTVVVRGEHDSGKTTVARLIEAYLRRCGYRQVTVADVPALPDEEKPDYQVRLARNQERRPVHIVVELEAPAGAASSRG